MKRTSAMIAGLAVVLVMAQAACAEGPAKEAKPGQGHQDKIFQELNLTPEQQQKLEANRSAQREEMTRLREQVREKQLKLEQELKNPAVTRAAIEPLVSDIKSLHAQMIDHRLNAIFAVKDILTPEQFAKFQQIVEKKREVKKERSRDPGKKIKSR